MRPPAHARWWVGPVAPVPAPGSLPSLLLPDRTPPWSARELVPPSPPPLSLVCPPSPCALQVSRTADFVRRFIANRVLPLSVLTAAEEESVLGLNRPDVQLCLNKADNQEFMQVLRGCPCVPGQGRVGDCDLALPCVLGPLTAARVRVRVCLCGCDPPAVTTAGVQLLRRRLPRGQQVAPAEGAGVLF